VRTAGTTCGRGSCCSPSRTCGGRGSSLRRGSSWPWTRCFLCGLGRSSRGHLPIVVIPADGALRDWTVTRLIVGAGSRGAAPTRGRDSLRRPASARRRTTRRRTAPKRNLEPQTLQPGQTKNGGRPGGRPRGMALKTIRSARRRNAPGRSCPRCGRRLPRRAGRAPARGPEGSARLTGPPPAARRCGRSACRRARGLPLIPRVAAPEW
jgi:hypothetical protein